MTTTYTRNLRLQKPTTSDRNWDVPINANADAIDAVATIGGLAVSTAESPSTTLHVGVAPGTFLKSDGTVGSSAGNASFTVGASSTVFLWLTDAGVLTSGAAFPAGAHLRLARVVTGATSVLSIVDERISCSVGGTGLGFVLKSGDTMTGSLTIASPGAGSPLVVADPVNRLVGFFGATPAGQAPVVAALASASSGVASDSLADVGTSFSQSVLNNNFASLAAKVDALIVVLQRHGLMGS